MVAIGNLCLVVACGCVGQVLRVACARVRAYVYVRVRACVYGVCVGRALGRTGGRGVRCACGVCSGGDGRAEHTVCVLDVFWGGRAGPVHGARAGCVLGGAGARRRVYDVRAGVCYVLCSLRV